MIHYECVKYECYISIIFKNIFISHKNNCMFYQFYRITILIVTNHNWQNESVFFRFCLSLLNQNWQNESTLFWFLLISIRIFILRHLAAGRMNLSLFAYTYLTFPSCKLSIVNITTCINMFNITCFHIANDFSCIYMKKVQFSDVFFAYIIMNLQLIFITNLTPHLDFKSTNELTVTAATL